jgi:AcrR family transcriptional regulator
MDAPIAEPLRRDARRNREALVAAACEVFAERGLDASLEAIAERADVSIGTLYNRFGGRLGLVDAVFADRVAAAAELAERALGHPDAWEGLAGHLVAIAEMQAADRGFTEVCVHTLPPGSAIERAKARGHAATEALVARAHAAGALRGDVELADIGLLVWSAVRATEGLRHGAPDAWRRHLAIVLDGLRAGAAHPLPGAPLDPAELRDAMRLG